MNHTARRVLPLLLCACLALGGCSAMLERDYTDIAPHNAAPITEGDPSTLRVDSYQELVNALIYLVEGHAQEGTIRLYMDAQELERSLDAACLEVVQEDPLGAYAVEFIKYKLSPVVTFSQADVQITYRRTQDQIRSIVQATGITAIRSELTAALSSYEQECVLRIGYFDGDEEHIRELARQAYCDAPDAALGMPQLDISIYPDAGRQRIVEILLSYPLEQTVWEQRRSFTAQALEELARPLRGVPRDRAVLSAAQAVLDQGSHSSTGADTPWELLTQGSGSSQALALTYAALCQQLDIPCQVVLGALDGQNHCWNVVRCADGWRHLDLTASQPAAAADPQMLQEGYSWDAALTPPCPAP